MRKLEQKLAEIEHALTKKQEEKKGIYHYADIDTVFQYIMRHELFLAALENRMCDDEIEIEKLREEHESTNSKLSADPDIIK